MIETDEQFEVEEINKTRDQRREKEISIVSASPRRREGSYGSSSSGRLDNGGMRSRTATLPRLHSLDATLNNGTVASGCFHKHVAKASQRAEPLKSNTFNVLISCGKFTKVASDEDCNVHP